MGRGNNEKENGLAISRQNWLVQCAGFKRQLLPLSAVIVTGLLIIVKSKRKHIKVIFEWLFLSRKENMYYNMTLREA